MAVYFLTAFAQLSRRRFIFVFCSGLIFLFHNSIDPLLSDPAYYFTAAIADASCILIGKMLSPIDKAIRKLQISCFAFIIINTYGYIIWFLYMQPFTYDFACSLAYICMILFSMRGEAKIDQPLHPDRHVHTGCSQGTMVSHKNGDHKQ